MLFNSWPFLFVFLPLCWIAFFFLQKVKRPQAAVWLLVGASLFFYAYWDTQYLPLLLLSISWNYAAGRWIEKTGSKVVLTVAVGGDLLALCFYKYAAFFVHNWNWLTASAWPEPEYVLPLGISFFTFTQIAYLVDTYRGETKKYAPGMYSLFVTFFPHLIAGPILYHKHVIPQFQAMRLQMPSLENLRLGLVFLTIGLFKKVWIADSLAPWVSALFDQAERLSFVEAWMAALGYTLQLYFDFSAYSEMAIALGLFFNIRLPINFLSPYQASSIIDFWRRWHMSLSAFLKDYLYIPLGGNRFGEFRRMRNLLLTMLLGGLWHGAGWTFVVWGGLHGLFLVVNHQWKKRGRTLPTPAAWLLTYLCVVCAWVFFRADSLEQAFNILAVMAGSKGVLLSPSWESWVSPAWKQWGIYTGAYVYVGADRSTMDLLKIAEVFVLQCCVMYCPSILSLCCYHDGWTVFKSSRKEGESQFWRASWAAMALGIMFFFIVKRIMGAQESAFLYFNF